MDELQDLTIEQLQRRADAMATRITALASKSALDPSEQVELDTLVGVGANKGKSTDLMDLIKARQADAERRRSALALATDMRSTMVAPGLASTNSNNSSSKSVVPVESADDKVIRTGGFKSTGHFLTTLMAASGAGDRPRDYQAAKSILDWADLHFRVSRSSGDKDEIHEAAKSFEAAKSASGMGSFDSTADFFLPMEFSNEIFTRREGLTTDLASRCDQRTIKGSSIKYRAWNDGNKGESYVGGGVLVYCEGEGDEGTLSKWDKGRTKTFAPSRISAFVALTDELIEDSANAVEDEVNNGAAKGISFKLNQLIWEGNGVRRCKGFTKSAAKIVALKKSGQAAGTIVAENIEKMWARFSAGYRGNSTWHVSQTVEELLGQLYLPTGANSGQLIYMPVNGLSQSPYSTLKSRPVIPTAFCEDVGTEGDIVLADWSQYRLVYKGQTKRDVSMHVKFMSHEQIFRFSFRVDGDCMWDTVETPLKGNVTTSCFVTMETRS